MRLRRLDLTRYGKFTDKVLDFGEKPASGPDFHLVYGPNEAGKSTAFDAYLALLFGIEARTPYNFLHDYKSMLVGGCLETEGRALDVRRIKLNTNDLRTASGELLPASALIGGILVSLSDLLGRTLLAPNEIPAGAFTTVLGGLWLVALSRRAR